MPSRQLVPGQTLVHLNTSVRPDQKDALETLALDDEQSLSYEVRRAVDLYLTQRGRLPVRGPVAV